MKLCSLRKAHPADDSIAFQWIRGIVASWSKSNRLSSCWSVVACRPHLLLQTMNDAIHSFLSSQLPIGGLAAYSLFSEDRTLASDCMSKSLYPSSTEEMLTRVVKTGRQLLPAPERSAQYCWTFEAHRVYVASRADGFSLAFLVENNPGTQLHRVQETLQGFLDLTEG